VFGFGGMRVPVGANNDLPLQFSPSIPKKWKKLSFKVLYRGAVISVEIEKTKTTFKTDGKTIALKIYDKEYSVDGKGVVVDIPEFFVAV
jgi:trehalose/maltose hydrolase-like predicted phosphorylase